MNEFSEYLGVPEERVDESRSETPFPVPPPSTTQNSLLQANHHVIQVAKHGGTFTLDAARLTANGQKHKVEIIIIDDAEQYDSMRLSIDGVTVHETAASWHQNGTVELNVDGRIVYFQWDLNQLPVWFCFRTKFADDVEKMSVEEKLWGDLEDSYSLVIEEKDA